jgi:hypothetical protein
MQHGHHVGERDRVIDLHSIASHCIADLTVTQWNKLLLPEHCSSAAALQRWQGNPMQQRCGTALQSTAKLSDAERRTAVMPLARQPASL